MVHLLIIVIKCVITCDPFYQKTELSLEAWPPRSPDLTPMDYWFWGMLKARIYHSFKPQNLDDLKQRIQDEIDKISMDELSRAVGNIRHRIDLVREVNGGTLLDIL